MDAWTQHPGARVEGHRAVARSRAGEPWRVLCSCGHRSAEQPSSSAACLLLVRHLEDAVRQGAAVLPGPGPGTGDGDAGVREPRRPSPPALPGAAALALVEPDDDAPPAGPLG